MNWDKIRDKMYLSGFNYYLRIVGVLGVTYSGIVLFDSEKGQDIVNFAPLGGSLVLYLAGVALRENEIKRYETHTKEAVGGLRALYKDIDKLEKEGRIIGNTADPGAVIVSKKDDILENKL